MTERIIKDMIKPSKGKLIEDMYGKHESVEESFERGRSAKQKTAPTIEHQNAVYKPEQKNRPMAFFLFLIFIILLLIVAALLAGFWLFL